MGAVDTAEIFTNSAKRSIGILGELRVEDFLGSGGLDPGDFGWEVCGAIQVAWGLVNIDVLRRREAH